jgi:glycosyltransferase involved in cell wall biosynthesis
MRILYFSDNISGHNQRFLRKLAASQNEVWFCDFSSAPLPANWLPAGIHPYNLSKPLSGSSDPAEVVALLPEIQKMIAEVGPDLIHAGPVQSCGYLAALAEFHPILLTSWGSDLLLYPERGEDWRKATKVAVGAADGLFVDSNWVLQAARTFGEIPDERVVIFPWGIEAGRFAPEGALPSETDFQREPGTYVFLCTRTWEPLYGMDTLMEAFRLAFQRNKCLRLMLIGGGSQAQYIYNFIRQHELEQVVTIPGQLDGQHLPQWFRVADGYISCAKADGTSISLLEAMATGLPVIVTDIPSNREWVTPKVNGWVAGDAGAFAEAMLRVTTLSADERASISEVNRKAVTERADWNRNFPKLLAMYEYLRAHPRKAFGILPSSM